MSTGADISSEGIARGAVPGDAVSRSDIDLLRIFVITAGIVWAILFVAIGLRYELQLYADGSIFSYAIAVRDAWAFHWHNVSGRLFVYLFAHLPAETYVALAGDARGGIALHGFLFFVTQLLGLVATYAADRSRGRVIFAYACCSTALLCPLVFGFPTEMWMAHALFWPALAVCHYARAGIGGAALVFAVLLALVCTHEGALIFAVAILATLLLRGTRDAALLRAAGALLAALSIWAAVRLTFTPDDYFAKFFVRAALNFFDVSILTDTELLQLLLGTIAGYGAAFLIVRRLTPTNAHVCAAAIVSVVLGIYWLWFDHALHAANRYYLRTAIVILTPVLGALAAAYALDAEGRLTLPVPLLPRLMAALAGRATVRAITGAVLLVTLVHAVETAKFVTAWTHYQAAVRALAVGTASDPTLGDPRFVSSARIGDELNRLSWFSTTHFLSVLVAPEFAPTRLVVDPNADFSWISCATATANLAANRVVPAESRKLVLLQTCLHR